MARALITQYVDALGVDLSFQGIESELDRLPGEYRPPRGRLLLALRAEDPAGCVALRPHSHDVCEMKRLFVRREHRGHGLGRLLATRLIDEGIRVGYRRMLLDTLPSMEAATALYTELGFRDIPPYRPNPVPGARFLALTLTAEADPSED